jgi:hypothetical protein
MIKRILHYLFSVEKYTYAPKPVTLQDYERIRQHLDRNPEYSLLPLQANTRPGLFLWYRLGVNLFLFLIGFGAYAMLNHFLLNIALPILFSLYALLLLFFSWYTIVQWRSHFTSLHAMKSYFAAIEQGIRASSDYTHFLHYLRGEASGAGIGLFREKSKSSASRFKRLSLRIFLCTFFGATGFDSNLLYAQEDLTDFNNRWQAGIIGGGHWFFSDLGGRPGIGGRFIKDWKPGSITATGGVQAAYNFNYRAAVVFTAQTGRLSADDSRLGSGDNSGRFYRNLRVATPVRELSISGRYTLRRRSNHVLNYFSLKPFSPYLSAGVGLLHFDPRVRWQSDWVSLRPLRTEGQGMSEYPDQKPYGAWTFFIPVTIGMQYAVSQRTSLSMELVFRKSFSDYLDDVSTRYIDPQYFSRYLSGTQLQAALALHDRSGEINRGINRNAPGDIRGLSGNDTWVSWRIGMIITLGALTPFY